jgi:ADP-ribosylglycohydrolase
VTAARYGELRDFHPWHGWKSGPKGTITDDTQLTIEVARTYLECSCLDPARFAERVDAWLDHGRGKGRTCTQAARRIRAGEPWSRSGVPSAGNGAAMRAAPIGLVRVDDLDALRLDAALSAIPTHADGMAIASACALAFAVAYLLRTTAGDLEPEAFIGAVVQSLEGIPDPGHPERRVGAGPLRVRLAERIAELPDILDVSWQEAMQRTWNGACVLESLPAAFYFFLAYRDDPEEAIVRAASAGYDCDTVASMTGNLIGAYHGLEALPERWRAEL